MLGDMQVADQQSAIGADTGETPAREMRHTRSLCTNAQVTREISKTYDK